MNIGGNLCRGLNDSWCGNLYKERGAEYAAPL